MRRIILLAIAAVTIALAAPGSGWAQCGTKVQNLIVGADGSVQPFQDCTGASIAGTAGEVTVAGTTDLIISLPATVDLASHTAFLLPKAAGSAPTTEGDVRFNSTNDRLVWGDGAATQTALAASDACSLSAPADEGLVAYQAADGSCYTVATGTAGYPLLSGGAGVAYAAGQLNLAGAGITGVLPATNVAATPLPTPGTSVTLSAPRGYCFITGGAGTCTPPTPAAGYEYCARNADNQANVITLANIASVSYEATARTSYYAANRKLVSGGVVTDQICVVGYDATHYAVMSSTGTWTDTAP